MSLFKNRMVKAALFCMIGLCVGTGWAITFNFPTLQTQFYAGGSLQYHLTDPQLSHLQAGKSYPFRLGTVTKSVASNVMIDGILYPTYTEYFDVPASEKFGVMSINSISGTTMNFTYSLYSATGAVLWNSRTINLAINSSFDLDGDSYNDVTYSNGITGRATDANVKYLTFNSSQSSLKTAMFSYIPEENTSLNIMSGHRGFNINGKGVIIPAMTQTGLGKTLAGGGMPVAAGDFIFDETARKYKIVSSTPTGGLAKTTATMFSMIAAATPTTDLSQAIPMASIKTTVTPISGDTKNIYSKKADYDVQRTAIQAKFDQYKFKKKLFTTSWMYDGGTYKAGLTTVTGYIGITANFSYTWKSVSGDLSAIVMFDDVLGITTVKNTTISSFDRVLYSMPVIEEWFMVGIVPCGYQISLNAGVKGSINMTAGSTLGIRNCAALSGKGVVDLHITKQSCDFFGNYNIIGFPEISTGTSSTSTVQAYFNATAQAFVLWPHSGNNKICPFYLQQSATLSCGPTFTLNTAKNTVSLKADANFSMPFEIGSEWLHAIKIGPLQCKWNWKKIWWGTNYTFWTWESPIIPVSNGVGYYTYPGFVGISNEGTSFLPTTNLLLLDD